MEKLPNEILCIIFIHLDYKDKLKCRSVCYTFNEIIYDIIPYSPTMLPLRLELQRLLVSRKIRNIMIDDIDIQCPLYERFLLKFVQYRIAIWVYDSEWIKTNSQVWIPKNKKLCTFDEIKLKLIENINTPCLFAVEFINRNLCRLCDKSINNSTWDEFCTFWGYNYDNYILSSRRCIFPNNNITHSNENIPAFLPNWVMCELFPKKKSNKTKKNLFRDLIGQHTAFLSYQCSSNFMKKYYKNIY